MKLHQQTNGSWLAFLTSCDRYLLCSGIQIKLSPCRLCLMFICLQVEWEESNIVLTSQREEMDGEDSQDSQDSPDSEHNK